MYRNVEMSRNVEMFLKRRSNNHYNECCDRDRMSDQKQRTATATATSL